MRGVWLVIPLDSKKTAHILKTPLLVTVLSLITCSAALGQPSCPGGYELRVGYNTDTGAFGEQVVACAASGADLVSLQPTATEH